MEHKIETVGGAPEQRVILDMSVEEFAGLYALHYRHGSGNPGGLRGRIESGLYAAAEALHPEWGAKIYETAPRKRDINGARTYNDGSTYNDVEAEFSS